MFHPSITQDQIDLVNARLEPSRYFQDGTLNPDWEDADAWYNRNKDTHGEDVAVIWFKAKAARGA